MSDGIVEYEKSLFEGRRELPETALPVTYQPEHKNSNPPKVRTPQGTPLPSIHTPTPTVPPLAVTTSAKEGSIVSYRDTPVGFVVDGAVHIPAPQASDECTDAVRLIRAGLLTKLVRGELV